MAAVLRRGVHVVGRLEAGGPNGPAHRLVLGCVDAVPVLVRPSSTEDEAVRDAVRGAGLQPPDDVHASADYRRHLAEVLAVRAVRAAEARAS